MSVPLQHPTTVIQQQHQQQRQQQQQQQPQLHPQTTSGIQLADGSGQSRQLRPEVITSAVATPVPLPPAPRAGTVLQQYRKIAPKPSLITTKPADAKVALLQATPSVISKPNATSTNTNLITYGTAVQIKAAAAVNSNATTDHLPSTSGPIPKPPSVIQRHPNVHAIAASQVKTITMSSNVVASSPSVVTVAVSAPPSVVGGTSLLLNKQSSPQTHQQQSQLLQPLATQSTGSCNSGSSSPLVNKVLLPNGSIIPATVVNSSIVPPLYMPSTKGGTSLLMKPVIVSSAGGDTGEQQTVKRIPIVLQPSAAGPGAINIQQKHVLAPLPKLSPFKTTTTTPATVVAPSKPSEFSVPFPVAEPKSTGATGGMVVQATVPNSIITATAKNHNNNIPTVIRKAAIEGLPTIELAGTERIVDTDVSNNDGTKRDDPSINHGPSVALNTAHPETVAGSDKQSASQDGAAAKLLPAATSHSRVVELQIDSVVSRVVIDEGGSRSSVIEAPVNAVVATLKKSDRLLKRALSTTEIEPEKKVEQAPTRSNSQIRNRRPSAIPTDEKLVSLLKQKWSQMKNNNQQQSTAASPALSMMQSDSKPNASMVEMKPNDSIAPELCVSKPDLLLLCNETIEQTVEPEQAVKKEKPELGTKKRRKQQFQSIRQPVEKERPDVVVKCENDKSTNVCHPSKPSIAGSEIGNERTMSTSSESTAGKQPDAPEPKGSAKRKQSLLKTKKGVATDSASGPPAAAAAATVRGKASRKRGKENTASESSFSVQDDKDSKDEPNGGCVVDTSTAADHLRWFDGIGYLTQSSLHFEFNHFGLVLPMAERDYESHCGTDVYAALEKPLAKRSRKEIHPMSDSPRLLEKEEEKQQTGGGTSVAKRKRKASGGSSQVDRYCCLQCGQFGRAVDFVTPEICSIACLKSSKNKILIEYIKRSTHALNMPQTTKGKENATNAKKLAASSTRRSARATTKQLPLETAEMPMTTTGTTTTSDDDSMSSLSLNSSAFLKNSKSEIRSLLPSPPFTPSSNGSAASGSASSTSNEETVDFSWAKYLKWCDAEAAPQELFSCWKAMREGVINPFKVGMKLEAIDPENNSLFCVCSVVKVRGYRMKLHFDGYPEEYDFWVNADSPEIFPPGWCSQTFRALQPPRGMKSEAFHWSRYLPGPAPQPAWFRHLSVEEQDTKNKFEVGMSLEADDLRKSGKVCVASVADKIKDRILVHFDGWDERYDYWVSIHSPNIHPINWHHNANEPLITPPDTSPRTFEWGKYVRTKGRIENRTVHPASRFLFNTRNPVGFKVGQRLEVVDPIQEQLIRPATIVAIDGYEIRVCFDGWPLSYAFWIADDSPDIHPINWCSLTKHPLEVPPHYIKQQKASKGATSEGAPAGEVVEEIVCEIGVCQGKGNSKASERTKHDRIQECPYKMSNWNNAERKKLRISNDQIQKYIYPKSNAPDIDEYGGQRSKRKSAINCQSYRAHKRPDVVERPVSAPTTDDLEVPVKRIKQEPEEVEEEETEESIEEEGPSTLLPLPALAVAPTGASQSTRGRMESKRSLLMETSASRPHPAPQSSSYVPPPKPVALKAKVAPRTVEEQQRQHGARPRPSPQKTNTDAITQQRQLMEIAKPVIEGYGPQLLHAYELWQKHSRFLDHCTDGYGEQQKNPLCWTIDETAHYIEQLPGCDECAVKIRLEEINGKSFLSFSRNDLVEYMGFKVGPATKIYNGIIKLRQLVSSKFIQL
ncbi:uncharacterized protein LOC118466398 isoform X2 [Anopheles albimanus]|nr:uncharacterized protein LOC118466398 isoform X2 [Anopheles albimanus]XP_035791549.1 uncharacterized protein LOC118466398 isoform X2 [Anopheles albimanus]XP_035791550.1 uncharacterized protein LOC118466398 isoform X2 [Anopheles albimanus]XP_035791551.1 uncharacterized protein LOC118466398 isoform X2 [Anopheles albimanus]XP_035791552.1 uncharacterized protein LOC118466398 isoform X2 [Anopheles albimanus]XP_035791553.1 uncharacterized protein LOC118466398 isoform X2 [Anopheles albimanus]XP_03